MDLLDTMRTMVGIYWKKKAKDESGDWTYELPQPIRCRWTNKQTREVDEQQNEQVFTSKVFVDRPMAVGDKIMLGKIANLKGPLPPPSEAKVIRKYDEISVIEPDDEEPVQDTEDWAMIAYL